MDALPGSYPVYRIQLSFPNDNKHHAIYVETNTGGVGQLLHVRCAVGRPGMTFERQYFYGPGPESLSTFQYKSRMGSVKWEDVEGMVDICSAFAAPETQYVDSACQCTVWVDRVAAVLRGQGILV